MMAIILHIIDVVGMVPPSNNIISTFVVRLAE
jgi:hypothetical protein